MIRKWVLTGQTYQGVGEVRHADQLLAKVNYDLVEEQGYFTVEEIGSREPLTGKGEKRLRGTITVAEGEEYLDKYGSLALRLSDGRVKQAIIECKPRWDVPSYRVIIHEAE